MLLVAFWSCKDTDDNQSIIPTPEVRTPPNEQAQLLSVKVYSPLTFNNSRVYTPIDSLDSSRLQEGMFFTKDQPAYVIILDQATGEILAYVKKDSLSNEVTINARNVALAMLESVPALSALSAANLPEALQSLRQSREFGEFEQFIGGRLASRTPIYRESETFVNLLLAMNRHINENFFEIPVWINEAETSRIDYSAWLKAESGGIMINNEYSFVEVSFTASNFSAKEILEPRGMIGTLFTPTVTPIAGLGLLDGCYTVRFTQETDDVYAKNLQKAIEKLILMAAGELFSNLNTDCKKDLIIQLYNDLIPFVNQVTSGQITDLEQAVEWIFTNFFDILSNLVKDGLSSEACLNILNIDNALGALIIEQLKTANAIVKAGNSLYDLAQVAPFIIACYPEFQIDFSMDAEIYFSALYPACLSVDHLDPFIRFETESGGTVSPGVLILERSRFDNWNPARFAISWIVEEGNGTISQTNTQTDSEAQSRIEWSFPEEFEGVARLVAEVKNKEGNHLYGSPLEFLAEVESPNVFIDPRDDRRYPIVEIGSQTWLGRNMNFFGGNSDCYDNNPENCRTFGRMYDWASALTACPPGWHLPNDAEWMTLIDFAGGRFNAGRLLKSTTMWNPPAINGTNQTGFNALPGGLFVNNRFSNLGGILMLWSATAMPPIIQGGVNKQTASALLVQGIDYQTDLTSRPGIGQPIDWKYYCRCIKDD